MSDNVFPKPPSTITSIDPTKEFPYSIEHPSIADGAITTNKIAANAVTAAKVGSDVTTLAFSTVKVGADTIAANGAASSLELVAGTGITLATDTVNDKVTISSAASGDMVKIAEVVLAGAQASVEFTNIPQTFRHLKLFVSALNTNAGAVYNTLAMRINGNTSAVYSFEQLDISGTSVVGGQANLTSLWYVGKLPSPSPAIGVSEIFIPNYASTTKNKVYSAQGGGHVGMAAGNLHIFHASGMTTITAAITSLTLFNDAANNLAAESVFTLYGVS